MSSVHGGKHRDGEDVMSSGRVFQNFGAATEDIQVCSSSFSNKTHID